MIIREFLDLISPNKKVVIKPNGRRIYFEGIAEEVPECLMSACVNELVVRPDEDTEHGFHLRLYVERVPYLDTLVDAISDIVYMDAGMYDGCYSGLTSDLDTGMEELKEIIENTRKERAKGYRPQRKQDNENTPTDEIDPATLQELTDLLAQVPHGDIEAADGEQ